AYQVYPHVDTGKDVDKVYLPERQVLTRELGTLNERLSLVEKREQLIVQQLSNLESQIERFNLLGGGTEETARIDLKKQWLDTKKQQQQDLAIEARQLQASISPLKGREENLSASFDTEGKFQGINERYDVRLPVVIPNGQAWISIYLLLTGMHALHLIVGLIALACWLPQKLVARKSPAFYVTCMYWQFVDAMWLTIFWFIYL
ncbi:MAG: cytochrome c oxidase subunit 3, partial [Pirellulaceae bacterium]|nr:cytochrome c oxidase subunit 3 [Pirellulaceae bacterium]